MEPGLCLKMLKKLREKFAAKFPATTRCYSTVKITRLNDASSEFFELEASPVEGQSLQQKGKKRRKRKGENSPEVNGLSISLVVQPHLVFIDLP